MMRTRKQRRSTKSEMVINSLTLTRKQLLNLEFEMARTSSKLEELTAKMELDTANGRECKRDRERRLRISQEYTANKQYLYAITEIYKNLVKEIDGIVEKFEGVSQEVVKLGFFRKGYTLEMIGEKTGYTAKQVARILDQFSREFIAMKERKS